MSLSPLFIFAIVSAVSAVAIIALLTRTWWSLKNLRVSFPAIGESAASAFLKKTFGSGKLEKKAVLWWGKSRTVALWLSARFLESRFVAKLKEKVDRILGKKMAIPDRETSSVFLKSIAEHKKKTREEEEVESEKF